MTREEREARSKIVGRIVRAVREHRGERQTAVAKAGGIKREELCMVEGGRHRFTTVEMRQAVAKGLRVPVEVIAALMTDDPISVPMTAAAFGVPVDVIARAVTVETPSDRPGAAS